MIEYVQKVGYEILEKNENIIKYKDLKGDILEYKVLKLFPFESSRKRMGIIVEKVNSQNNQLIFYIKGADDVIREKVMDEDKRILIDEKTFELASIGLRTLCFGKKTLSKD